MYINERSKTISIDYASIYDNDDDFDVYLTNFNVKKKDNPVNEAGRSKNRNIVQDVYDEDHYCLARNSGFFTDEPNIPYKQDNTSTVGSSRTKKCTCTITCTRNRIIFAILIIIIFLLGGCVTYLVLKGILLYPSLGLVYLSKIIL